MSLALDLQEGALLTHREADGTAGRRGLNRAMLYTALVICLPLVAIPFFIALGSSDFFLHHGASVWVRSNDSIFAMRDRQCDVLIFGDSTAMTGIDPALVDRDTGLRTCNIAVTNAVLAVTGNLPLQTFLQQNARPRMLVVQLSPDDFQQRNRVWNHTVYAEGLLELLRHGTPEQSRHLLLSHPHEAIAFAGYAAGYTAFYGLKDVWFRATHMRSEEDEIQVRNGFFTPPSPARTNCEGNETQPADASSAFAESITHEYQEAYGGQGSVVLVDVAPIPSCDQNLAAYARELRGVTNNRVEGLPVGLFNDSRHYTAFGSRVVSALISRQVNQAAHREEARDAREAPNAHEAPSIPRQSPPLIAGLHTVAIAR